MSTVYAIDLGNGFSKRLFGAGKRVVVDPSVYAQPLDYFKTKPSGKLISVNNNDGIYIGQDAFDSGYQIRSVLGDSGSERYRTPQYKELLFGFIGKDFKKDTHIDVLVLGLPVDHYKREKNTLVEFTAGKKVIVEVDNKQITVSIDKTIVMPQPLGTYMHLEHTGHDIQKHVLVVDGGYGTLDITEMKGQEVLDYHGMDNGMKYAYKEIMQVLKHEYTGLKTSLPQVPYILRDGLKYSGDTIRVNENVGIQNILNKHFEEVYNFIIDIYENTKKFDEVIWTGGMATAHESRIFAKDQSNYTIVDEGQDANVRGFFDFGKAFVDAGTVQSK